MHYLGRLHPLLVHLPIGILFLSFGLECLARFGGRTPLRPAIRLSLGAGAMSAVAAAFTGWWLAGQGGYDESLLNLHRWSAVSVAALSVLVWWGAARRWYFPVFCALILLLTAAGHFGGSLTHGANYLFASASAPNQTDESTALVFHPDSSVFAGLIQPVLKQKCVSCHNAEKQKGKLRLDTPAFIQKGGKDGAVIVPGKPRESLLLTRPLLPLHHDDHMPPAGKPQLSDAEVHLIEWWIAQGANFLAKQRDLPVPEDVLKGLINTKTASDNPVYKLPVPAVQEKDVQQLRDLFVSVRPAGPQSPLLSVSFAGLNHVAKTHWEALRQLRSNIIDLDLAFTDASDGDLSGFPHLVRLNLAHTRVTDGVGQALRQLNYLESLNLTGTPVTDTLLASLADLPRLNRVFLWGTAVTHQGVEKIRKKRPHLILETGAASADTARLALRAPKLLYGRTFFNDTLQVALDFPSIKGVSLYYTLDEAASPTTQSAKYREKIVLQQTAHLRAFAAKDGWLPSPVVDALLVKKSITPVGATIVREPSPKYPAKGAPSLIDGEIAAEQGASTWLGYEGEHLTATLDLGREDTVRRVFVHCLENNVSWIFKPVAIQVAVSKDGKVFSPRGQSQFSVNKSMGEPKAHLLACDLPEPVVARYLRVEVKNLLKNPPWHPGAGAKCWIFVDEIMAE